MGGEQDDEAVCAEQLGHRSRERRREIRLRSVVALEPRRYLASELRLGRAPLHCVEHRLDSRAQRLAIERQRGVRRVAAAQLSALDFVGWCDQVDVVRFLEVVIVSGHPEDRHHGPTQRALQRPRQRDRGERLVHGEQRSGQESRLLPRRHAERLAGQQLLQPGARRAGRHEGLFQARVDTRAAGRDARARVERGPRGREDGLEPEAHRRSAMKMARGAWDTSGPPP